MFHGVMRGRMHLWGWGKKTAACCSTLVTALCSPMHAQPFPFIRTPTRPCYSTVYGMHSHSGDPPVFLFSVHPHTTRGEFQAFTDFAYYRLTAILHCTDIYRFARLSEAWLAKSSNLLTKRTSKRRRRRHHNHTSCGRTFNQGIELQC